MSDYTSIFKSIDKSVTETFSSIYKTMTNLNISTVNSANLNDFKRNYTTTMGLNGHIEHDGKKTALKGSVIICWELNSYIIMAGKMLGEEFKEYVPEIDDVGMEILNTTVGNSKPKLNEVGVFIQMSLPTGFIGAQKITESGKNVFSNLHVYDSDAGKLCIIVNCLAEEELV